MDLIIPKGCSNDVLYVITKIIGKEPDDISNDSDEITWYIPNNTNFNTLISKLENLDITFSLVN